MKFDWSGYLDLARELAVINNSDSAKTIEAKLRSSMSRAYYAAFCLARNYLRDNLGYRELSKSKKSDLNVHRYVIKELQGSRDKKMREIGFDLEKLREKRNMVDYDDVFSKSVEKLKKLQNEANYCLKLAENIIAKINELVEDIDT